MFYRLRISRLYKKGDLVLSLLRSSYLALLLATGCLAFAEATDVAEDNQQISEEIDNSKIEETKEAFDQIEEAPAYNKLLPIKGWNRYSGDTAETVGEWKRWWKYINLKKPVIMKWIRDLNLRIYPKNEVFRAIFVRGIYDPNLLIVIDSLLPAKGVFFDIGSNMGYCSLIMSKVVGEDGKIIAIEPSERDFLRLVDNVNLNKLNNVSVHRVAISDAIGKVKIFIAPEERSALNTLGTEFSNKGIEKINVETVDATTLDAFVEKVAIEKIDVIKMDIEGSELKALKGAKNSIEKYRPTLIVGINSNSLRANNSSMEELEIILKDLRYKIYSLTETPFFALKEVENLTQVEGNLVVCMHESFVPPVLPQVAESKFVGKIQKFFTD